MKIQSIKGVKDILPGEVETWQYIEKESRALMGLYGFSEIKIPIFEFTELFTRSIGETSDIVEKEMYTFTDRDGKKITLRPEGTASVVRAYIEHHLHNGNPLLKLYYMGPMFRHERPQAGRLRQFYQIGAEIFGSQAPLVDVELLAMLDSLLKGFNLPAIILEINSVGCEACRPAYKKNLLSFFKSSLEHLCPNCHRRINTNPLRILDCKSEGCREITQKAPSIHSFLCHSCEPHFKTVVEGLSELDISFTLNPRLVRGLDYYTKTAFEFTCASLGAQNAVAAGGRYDGLVDALGGPKTPGIGFALGMERLVSLIKTEAFPNPLFLYWIVVLGDQARMPALKLATQLRHKGFLVEMGHQGGSLKSQLRQANKKGARYVIMIGDNEIEKGKVTLRDMENKKQSEIDMQTLATVLEPS